MMQLYGLDSDSALARTLAASLGVPMAPHEDRGFEDGECKLRPLIDPRGADVYVIYSLYGDLRHSPHDKLCRLLMFISTLREHGAARVSAVLPYLAYARKDRQTKIFDPVNLRYVAQMFESMGTTQLIVLEAHNVAALQNAFRCQTLHLDVYPAFESLVAEIVGNDALAVASPDPGGVKRAQRWRESLESTLNRTVGFAMVDKRRSAGIVSSDNLLAGDVNGMNVLLFDDLIASGDTMNRAASALRQAGARQVIACAAHGLFISPASDILASENISKIIVTDSVPPFRLELNAKLRDKLCIASAVPLFARAINLSYSTWKR